VNPVGKIYPADVRRRILCFSLAAVALQFIAVGEAAAGLPDKGQLATGEHEVTLSGVRVGIRPVGTELPEGTPISEIVKLYGPPASKEDAVVPDGAGGTRFYRWEWPGLKMSVATYFFYCPNGDTPNGCSPNANRPEAQRTMVESAPEYIDVWGDGPKGNLGITGRGLALGSTLEQQKALYGNRYETLYTEKDGTTHIQMEWSSGAYLMIDYGPSGHSNHMRLTCRER
jgi:hypothetical protein